MEDSTQKVKQNDTEKYHSKTEYKCEEPVTLSHLEEMKVTQNCESAFQRGK